MYGRQVVKVHASFKFGISCRLLVSLILPNFVAFLELDAQKILQGGAVTPCPIPNMRITHCRLFVTSGYLYCSDSEFAEATMSLACGLKSTSFVRKVLRLI
jgi:hypothetical protein